MENRKEIYRVGLVLGVLTFLISIINMSMEALVLGVVSLILNFCNRKVYRVKAGSICALLGMAISIASILFMIYTIKSTGGSYEGYWLFKFLNKM